MPESPNDVQHSGGAATGDLASLYRMSKTAGLASSDYQAVNVCSVVSVVGGLLSFLASFDAVLLIIPLGALILGIVALVQINRSNRTQTGMLLAILGILLSLGLGAWAGTAKYREAARTANDRRTLVATVENLSQLVKQNRLEDAYNLFSDTFKQRVDRKKFEEPWNFYRERNLLKGISSNGLFVFENDPNSGISVASGQLILGLDRGENPEQRVQVFFSNRGGEWRIENLPDFYPLPRTGGAPGP